MPKRVRSVRVSLCPAPGRSDVFSGGYPPLNNAAAIKDAIIIVVSQNGQWRASCRFRDMEGVTRTYSKFSTTRGKAESSLLMAMKERQGQGCQPDQKLTLEEVAGMWLGQSRSLHRLTVAAGRLTLLVLGRLGWEAALRRRTSMYVNAVW